MDVRWCGVGPTSSVYSVRTRPLRQNAQNCTFADQEELVEAFGMAVARIGRLVPGALSKSARRAKFLTRFLMGREPPS